MNLRLTGLMLLVGSAAGFVAGCETEQPATECTLAHGYDFSAKYKLVSGSGACAELPGEALGLANYNIPGEALQPFAIRPEVQKFSIIRNLGQVEELAQPFASREITMVVGRGAFQSKLPNENDLCVVPTITPVTTEIGSVTAPDPATYEPNPETGDLEPTDDSPDKLYSPGPVPASETPRYEFSDVSVYVTPAVPGQQMKARLRYTEGACTAEYDVIGMFPAIPCSNGEPPDPTTGLYTVDPSACEPERDIAAGRVFGSGINPAFRTCCSARTGYCVLATDEIGEAALDRDKSQPIGVCP